MDIASQPQLNASSDVNHTSPHRAWRRHHRPSRRRMTVTVLAAALAAGAAPAAHSAATGSPATPTGNCLVTSPGNSMTFDVTALLTTVRLVDGTMEVLHDIQCSDGRGGAIWIAGDIIPSTRTALFQHTESSLPCPRPNAPGGFDPPMLTAATGDLPLAPTA
jgi:hypothetical protein